MSNFAKKVFEDTISTKLDIANQESIVNQFRIFGTDISVIKEAIHTNLDAGDSARSDIIKMPSGGRLTFAVPGPDGEEDVRELSTIMLEFNDARTYYSTSMEESGGKTPPDCSSPDARTGFGRPGGDCRKCQLAQWGSAPKGAGQACKLYRYVNVFLKGDVLPTVVRLSAGSIEPCRDYLRRLARKGLPSYNVVSSISLERTKNSQQLDYSRAVFKTERLLTPEELQIIKQLMAAIRPSMSSTKLLFGSSGQSE